MYPKRDSIIAHLGQRPEDREKIQRLKTLISNQQVYSILKVIEQAKIDLSYRDAAKLIYSFMDIDINQLLTREEYQALFRERIEQVKQCIRETFTQADVKPEEINLVLKVGGSSNNIFVNRLLHDIFTNVGETNTLTTVAAGLAIAANNLFR